MTFNFNFRKGFVDISMDKALKDIIASFRSLPNATNPCTPQLFDDIDSPLLSHHDAEFFHSTVAKLLYCAKRVLPALLLPISYLCTRVKSPTENDFQKLVRIVAYLSKSNNSVRFSRLCIGSSMVLHCYVDASFGVHPSRHSHTGCILLLGNAPLHFSSLKQKLIVKSSTEAELVSVSDMLSEILWLCRFLKALSCPAKITLHQDNSSTICMINSGSPTNPRTRHIDVRYFFVKQHVDSGLIKVVHCPTADMLADILTKPLPTDRFHQVLSHFYSITNIDNFNRSLHPVATTGVCCDNMVNPYEVLEPD